MTPLMYAVKDNRTAFLDRMIELGADIGARNNVSPQIHESVARITRSGGANKQMKNSNSHFVLSYKNASFKYGNVEPRNA
jgi:ankyrin repeat protein